jgi:hypothetical protein
MQTLFSFLHRPALYLSLAAACLASGCAVERTQVGSTSAQVIDSYGQPTRAVALADGTRLQYSRQPMGQSAIMVDLDKADRVVSVRQALTAENFAKAEIGKWTRETAEREFGPPAFIQHFASWQGGKGDVLVYRWKDASQDMFFYVYLDLANVVQQIGQGMEFKEVREPRDQ